MPESRLPRLESPVLTERAPAKVNLSLRVLGRRADGYHELSSVVAFAGAGDRLTLQPGETLTLDLAGPGAAILAAGGDNLVLRAARELGLRIPGLRTGRFSLDKRLPVAAGIGGGSADAAAALRLLARANGLPRGDDRLFAAALATGSDVPACLYSRSCVMAGRGEALTPLALPRFGALLVNPRVPVATADVFRALGLAPGAQLGAAAPVPAFAGRGPALFWLAGEPNDLEAPARRLAPVLDEVDAALRATPDAGLVRMSGSGATMFALYPDCRAAARAGKQVAGAHPAWWVKPTVLG
ncbi:4-(cytidine 5'-diphospho)-2-C-methyl-D-erythritol kinase [Ancylobacter amanitiformis]|uniref:4-diphosphocytidyl-2-C-methyl-D-erythritol kinase n=1 Tax=Ancylobacter amanitiformis TaxID=217069 RepID=A0ABU0LQU2_9HYPH|nr:4-(cytidine 5'-diphospho)-2-C-methyl-D-erythritol kinase [Ancylobacter amanitiformis]MDQ0511069.1 4-diphosphocytidyl-2-C-methyl-D-erythritol kinase [Ancylobacter amanitiformis]